MARAEVGPLLLIIVLVQVTDKKSSAKPRKRTGEPRWGLVGLIPTEIHVPGFTFLLDDHSNSKMPFFFMFLTLQTS